MQLYVGITGCNMFSAIDNRGVIQGKAVAEDWFK